MSCMVCGNDGETFAVREMMFGTREPFEYLKCDRCGCLTLVNPPARLADYYPAGYYAHAPIRNATERQTVPIRRWLRGRRNEAQIFQKRGLWGAIARRRPRPDIDPLATMLRPTAMRTLDARILDVGCGNADLLLRMHEAGFSCLLGIDPFLTDGSSPRRGFRVEAISLELVTGPRFDLIMFHHSLEHMPDQVGMLMAAAERLEAGGTCLVRIPVLTEKIWREFGTDWVEIDAPRHHCIHTPTSLAIAAARAGLEIYGAKSDSTGFTYWGSELYRRGVPLYDPRIGALRRPEDVFDAAEIGAFEAAAAADNALGEGARAAFYLRPASSANRTPGDARGYPGASSP